MNCLMEQTQLICEVVDLVSSNPGIFLLIFEGSIEILSCKRFFFLCLSHSPNQRIGHKTTHFMPLHHLLCVENAVHFRFALPPIRQYLPFILPSLFVRSEVDLRHSSLQTHYHHQSLDLLLLHLVNIQKLLDQHRTRL